MLGQRRPGAVDMMHRNSQLPPHSHQYGGAVDKYSRHLSSQPIDRRHWDDELNDATYELDHLATYTISPHRGMSTPDDAVARLRLMVVRSGVWTRRLRLRVGSRDLVIVDGMEAVERFPLKLVGPVTCSTTCDSFDNVVAFSVAGDALLDKPGEIHVFQCIGSQCHDLVNDIEAAKASEPLPSKLMNQPTVITPIYPRPHYQLPQVARPMAVYSSPNSPSIDASPNHSESSQSTNAPQSLSPEERKRIDLKALSLCFEDIENFVAKLQRAALDANDLSKQEGERSKPPEAKHFYDIFQKFKLCFILLARLKRDITDPNAPELAECLFTPLTLIVDASRTSDDNQPHLGASVVCPLLTSNAIELLTNCLSSKSIDVWRSLGPAWKTPRNLWTGHVPLFVLVFGNRTSPPKIWIDEIMGTSSTDDNASLFHRSNGHSRQQSQGTDIDEITSGPKAVLSSADAQSSSNAARQNNFLRDLQARGAKICSVIRRRDSNNPKEITVEVDEILEVVNDTKNWWKVRNCNGQEGFVPNTILRPRDIKF